jgi:hypothetical protein
MGGHDGYTILTISLTIVTTFIVVLVVKSIHSWFLDKRFKKSILYQLNEILDKGYSWAVIPKDTTELHDQEKNPYVSAKKESVQLVGRFPSGISVYRTESGDTFSYHGIIYSSVIVDVARNVYLYVNDAEIVDRRLVLTNNDNLILPKKFHLINDPQEAKDYLEFRLHLFLYFDESLMYSEPIAHIDNELPGCIGTSDKQNDIKHSL